MRCADLKSVMPRSLLLVFVTSIDFNEFRYQYANDMRHWRWEKEQKRLQQQQVGVFFWV